MIKRSAIMYSVSAVALMTAAQLSAAPRPLAQDATATAPSATQPPADAAVTNPQAVPPAATTTGVTPAAPSETLSPQDATTAPPPEDNGDAPDEVVVTGIRQSLERAAEIKRDAVQVVDSIVAQDIGKLPDPTTAAALQRVPGVQVSVNRNNELGDVRVRGLPDILTTVNGREVFTTTARTFDLQDIPAEALARVDVFKSQTADLIEGGLAGAIDLRLNRPFSFKKPTAVLSARTNYGIRDKHFGPQLGALLTNRWDTPIGEIGLLANGTYSRQDYTRASTILAGRRSSLTSPFNTPGLLLPNLLQNFPETGFIERQQFNASGQWQVSPAVQVYAEGFYTYFRDRGAHEGANSQPNTASFGSTIVSIANVVPGTQCITARATNAGQNPAVTTSAGGVRSIGTLFTGTGVPPAGNYSVQTVCQPESATFNNIALNQTNQARDLNQRNKQIAGGVSYDQDGWKANVDVAFQRSRYQLKNIIADVGQRLPTIDVDFDNDGSAAFTTSNTALIQPTNLILRNSLQQQYDFTRGQLFQVKGEGERDFDSFFLKNLKAGARYAQRKADFQSVALNTPVPDPNGTTTSPNFGNAAEGRVLLLSRLNLPANFLALSALAPDLNGGARFLVPSTDFLLSEDSLNLLRPIFRLPLGRPGYDATRQFDAKETTTAAFAQADYDIGLTNSISIDGVVGARLVSTDRDFTGFRAVQSVTNGPITYQAVSSSTTDRDVLPAATARLKFGSALQFRAGYQKSIRRPNFTDLSPVLTLNRSFNPLVQSTGTAGNPDLKEQKSDSYDATAELYFHGGYIAVAGYYRNIKNRVISGAAIENYNGIDYAVNRPRNVGKARLQGVEVSSQYFADFLPGPLSGFGLQGSFTYSDSKVKGNDPLAGYALQGVSKYNYTTGLLYDKYGISGRLVYTFRSKYLSDDLTGNASVLRPIDPARVSEAYVPTIVTYNRGAGRLDFNIGADVSDALRIDIGGTNILKNRTQGYFGEGSYTHINNQTQYDETTYTIGARLRF